MKHVKVFELESGNITYMGGPVLKDTVNDKVYDFMDVDDWMIPDCLYDKYDFGNEYHSKKYRIRITFEAEEIP